MTKYSNIWTNGGHSSLNRHNSVTNYWRNANKKMIAFYYCTPSRVSIIKKSKWWMLRVWVKGNSGTLLLGMKDGQLLWKTAQWFLKKVNTKFPCDWAASTGRVSNRYGHSCSFQHDFTVATMWKHWECLPVMDRQEEMWHISKLQYYSDLKKRFLNSQQNG